MQARTFRQLNVVIRTVAAIVIPARCCDGRQALATRNGPLSEFDDLRFRISPSTGAGVTSKLERPSAASQATRSTRRPLWPLVSLGMIPLAPLLLTGCLTQTTLGEGGSIVSGAASESTVVAIGEAKELQKCNEPFATVALSEGETNKQQYVAVLAQMQLPQSPIPLLRLMFQQSNCFQIVDRGKGLQAISTEQQLAKQGMLKEGSNITGGQLVAAGFTITPNIVFSDQNAGGIGAVAGILGAVIPGAGLLGGISVSMKEA